MAFDHHQAGESRTHMIGRKREEADLDDGRYGEDGVGRRRAWVNLELEEAVRVRLGVSVSDFLMNE